MVDFVPGRAMIDVAQRKRGKYIAKCVAIGYVFLPFSFSSLGELEADAVTLSIDQGPFEMGTTRSTLGTTPEGGVLLGPERPRTYDDLSSELTKEDRESQLYNEFERFKMLPGENINEYYSHQYPSSSAAPQSPHIQSLQHLQFPETSQLDSGQTQTDEILDNLSKQMALLAQSFRATLPQTNNQLQTLSNTRNQAIVQDGRILVQNVQGRQNQNQNQRYFAQGNGAAGNGGAQNRARNANAGQGKPIKCYNCNRIGHIAQNCTQPKRPHNVDNQPVPDLSLNEDYIFQVHIPENVIDLRVTNQDDQEIHNEVLQASAIDSTSVDMGNSNVIPYEQYLMFNTTSAVPSCASADLNDACVLSDNDVYVPHDPLATELKIYKEQVAIYEQRAKFEPTEHEQRMDDQMHMEQQKAEKLKASASPMHVLPPATVYPPNTPVHLVPRMLPTTSQVNIGLIAQDVFYTVTNSALTASRFHDLSIAYNVALTRAADLEAENSGVLEKIKQDDHDTMIKDFSKLEVAHLNLQLKHQHLKKNIENFKSKSSKDVPEFDTFFELSMRDDQIQSHKNTIRKLKAQISELKDNKSDELSTIDSKSLDSQNSHLKETVTALQERLENFKAENEKVKRHYQELFDSIKITFAKTLEKTSLLQNEIENLKTQLNEKMQCVTSDVKSPKDNLDTRRKIVEEARSELPSDNNLDYAYVYTKRSQELLANHVTFADLLETSGTNTPNLVKQQSVSQTNVSTIPSTGVSTTTTARRPTTLTSDDVLLDAQAHPTPVEYNIVVQIVLWYLDSGCSKHMIGDHSRLRNFMKKFIGTVRFGNDHFGAIMGYGDYVIDDNVICKVYDVKELGHNLFSVGQFCDSDLEVAFRKHTCFIRDLDGVDLIKGN
ncbi:integrase, catalytic region, zinc finger, CCHC-type containing protein [Tanacetum coccineum]